MTPRLKRLLIGWVIVGIGALPAFVGFRYATNGLPKNSPALDIVMAGCFWGGGLLVLIGMIILRTAPAKNLDE